MRAKDTLSLSSSQSSMLIAARLGMAALIAIAMLATVSIPAQAAAPRADARFDLTGDGRVTYQDVIEVVLTWTTLEESHDPCGEVNRIPAGHDVDGDGCVTVFDIQAVAGRVGSETDAGLARAFNDAPFSLDTTHLTMIVNSTGDAVDANPGDGQCRTSGGVCTLRAAIMEANARPGPETINFNIPGTGVREIQLTSELPTISDETGGVFINGYSQPGSQPNTDPLVSNAVIRVQIRGGGRTAYDAIRVSSKNNEIRGLAFYNLRRNVWFAGARADYNIVAGCFLGINASGGGAATGGAAGAFGAYVSYAGKYNRIGGSNPADRNIIGGNGNDGVAMDGDGTWHNIVQGNLIGLSPNGASRLVNRSDGIDLNNGASYTIIGGLGPGERNVISGNQNEGVEISHQPTTSYNEVIGNFIGTNVTGVSGGSTFRNGGFGVSLEDRSAHNIVGPGNVMANNGRGGMEIYGNGSTGNRIFGNRIGVNVNDQPLANVGWGIRLRYHASNVTIGPDNIIAHNTQQGVLIIDPNVNFNTVTRNSIYNNGGLGIDIDPIGVNPNDAYSKNGANGRQNFPVITVATTTEVRGQSCAGCVVEIFLADSPAGAHGEGRTFLGSGVANAGGGFAIPLTGVSVGQVITSTATAPNGNTSEFSLNVALQASAPTNVPGTIQMEDFTSAHDSTPGNAGGAYRESDVDIQTCSDPVTPSGQQCFNVGWTEPGEWLEYQVNVATSGWYAFALRAASPLNNRSIQLEIDGQNVSGPVAIPNTGGYQTWTSVPFGPFQLSAGQHTLRFVMGESGINLNFFATTATAPPANQPPSVSIVSPPGGQVVEGDVTVSVTASDDLTPVHALEVQVSIDGGAWQPSTWNAGSSRFEWVWDTTALAPGPHTVTARATDGGGLTTISAPLSVTKAGSTGIAIPGRVEAEDYSAALDTTSGNSGGAYRSGDVDIQPCTDAASSGSCFNVGWTDAGEWLEWSISIASSGHYAFTVRYATPSNGRTVSLRLDGADITDSILLPNTGGYQAWNSVTTPAIQLPAGSHTLRVVFGSGNVNLNFIDVAAVDAPPPPPPPTLPRVPGRIEVEDYRDGGAGVGYNDTTSGNAGGLYRSDDVDIQACSDASSGPVCYNVGWTDLGEWLAYDVEIASAGFYTFTVRYATPSNGRSVRFELNGVDVTGAIALPNTGGYQVWSSVTSAPVELPAGQHTLRLVLISGNTNLNFFETTAASEPPPPAPPTLPQLPGKLEAEDYRQGGPGVGYVDTTPGNNGGVYRNEDVDIQACSDPLSASSCYNVGWTEPGEWLAFDVHVPVAGSYVFTFRYASPSSSPRRVRVEIDGVDVSGQLLLAPTGGYQVWADGSTGPIAIDAGDHTVKILIESSGLNLNYIAVTAS